MTPADERHLSRRIFPVAMIAIASGLSLACISMRPSQMAACAPPPTKPVRHWTDGTIATLQGTYVLHMVGTTRLRDSTTTIDTFTLVPNDTLRRYYRQSIDMKTWRRAGNRPFSGTISNGNIPPLGIEGSLTPMGEVIFSIYVEHLLDGPYTTLRVTQADRKGFRGWWSFATGMAVARDSGYYCAQKQPTAAH
jgi:hypothetical protein